MADGHAWHGDQPGGAQQIAPFQQRVGDGGKVRLDPLQLAHDVELQAASLDNLAPCLDPRELSLGRGPLEFTEPLLFLHQTKGRVQVLTHEGANWKGAGTALALAEASHEVTIVTPAGMVAKEVER